LEFSVCNVPANPYALANEMTGSKQAAYAPSIWGHIINNFEGAKNG
jgi:hypothetical protein